MVCRFTLVCLAAGLSSASAAAASGGTRGHDNGAVSQGALLQTWTETLDASAGKATPITRVVNLLKDMQATLQKDQEEDEKLFDKLGCWCNNNRYEKDAAITAATAKISELKSTIDASTAKSSELKEKIKELEAEVAANKAALAEATAQREKEAKAFHKEELDAIQAVGDLEAAIHVLSKHTGAALPQLSLSFLSLASHGKDIPWTEDHESNSERSFNDFMRHSGLADQTRITADDLFSDPAPADNSRFLQKEEHAPVAAVSTSVKGWTTADTYVVQRAMKAASAFVQRKNGGRGEFYNSYAPQSGEIMGVMKQLKDEMEASLSASQKAEKEAASTFNEMRAAKTAEIENGETMSERKEDELAETNNALAEAKEDLDQTTAVLTEDQKFMVNLKATCSDADANFAKRKAARLQEIKAVSETIEILNADEAKDLAAATYSFVQTATSTRRSLDLRRQRAAALLRKAAAEGHSPELSVLATTVELDAFTRVKKAIDDMVAQLKTQQADEVKKSDWCKAEFQSNDMSTMKATSLKGEQEMKVSDLESTVEKLTDEVTQAKKDIAQLQLELQRASENRKQANKDFQKTVAEQSATQEILKKALDKLATFYDAEFAQTHSKAFKREASVHGQTPPVAEATYEKNSGASGVMSMIEKLIHEAAQLTKDSKKGEQEEQAQYESLVEDTNGSVKSLSKLIVTKTGEKAAATKEKIETEGDLKDTEAEIEGLGKYDADLHGDCDYILKNFDTRQEARQQEIEALQQAKSILSGATAR